MGFAYTYAASATMDRIERACKETREPRGEKSSNVYFASGKRYFFEIRRRDRADGGLGGTIHLCLGETLARQVGTFIIDGTGRVRCGPALFRHAATR